MLHEYIRAAMETAKYEIIKDEEPYYGSIPACRGVWATGRTLEECRKNLEDILDGWILLRVRRGLALPAVKGKRVLIPGKARMHA